MSRRLRGLFACLGLVCLAACRQEAPHKGVSARDRLDAGRDAAVEAPNDAAADAARVADAESDGGGPRGSSPLWPEAEQEVELSLGESAVSVVAIDAEAGALDVHLNVDTTGSIRFAIDELQGALRSDVIQRLRDRVPDVSFGVSRYADFPLLPFGADGSEGEPDRPYLLLTPVTSDVGRVIAAVNALDRPLDQGGDIPEASAEALYQVATGAGYRTDDQRFIERWSRTAAPGGGALGGVGFRAQALHVVLHVADSPSHEPADYDAAGLSGTRSRDAAITALREVGARVISIMPTTCTSDACRENFPFYASTRAELSQIALATGARVAADSGRCRTGLDQQQLPAVGDVCPLVFDAREDGSGLSRALSDAVLSLLDAVRFAEVRAEVASDHLDFIESVRPEPVAQVEDVPAPGLGDWLPQGAPDGVPDGYTNVERRARLGFAVTLKNQRIAPSEVPQRFRVAIRVLGDGILLQERVLAVVVPGQPGKLATQAEAGGAGSSD